MLTFLAIIHCIIGIGLIIFVLLQDPKDGAAGVFGGGSSSKSFFGASGASNFLTTTTKWLAVLFACTCLLMTGITTKHSTSVMDDATVAPPVPSAAQPSATPPAEPKQEATPAPATPATPNSK
jgi:preprotein translocase subunit SecG